MGLEYFGQPAGSCETPQSSVTQVDTQTHETNTGRGSVEAKHFGDGFFSDDLEGPLRSLFDA